ncbi:uncharacterized protein LOC111496534 [Cucurbita maxima]|uniref:Uncharacterized protein LOC111496534 n=1 Tax=Cucurbita maxima TaxID=3661 RepID=A0A6J1KM92_CUCMA|nr:uncharacterized protein LOC111496534 [Cucurbita maxima]
MLRNETIGSKIAKPLVDLEARRCCHYFAGFKLLLSAGFARCDLVPLVVQEANGQRFGQNVNPQRRKELAWEQKHSHKCKNLKRERKKEKKRDDWPVNVACEQKELLLYSVLA